jgi:hypothetical protein
MRAAGCEVRVAMAAAMLTLCGAAAPAHAYYGFPEEAQKKFPALDCTLNCLLCHGTLAGGDTNWRYTPGGGKGLGETYREKYGLRASELGSVSSAFDAAAAARSDIDGDGVTDFAELTAGRDPYDPDPDALYCGGSAAAALPSYGCGEARLARGTELDEVATVFGAGTLIAAAGAARLRRSRRARRRPPLD